MVTMALSLLRWMFVGLLTAIWLELMPFVLLAALYHWTSTPTRRR